MKYPHRRYLTFLISKGYRPGDIAADCAGRGLLLPNDDSLQALSDSLGVPPARPSVGLKSRKFQGWVKDIGVLSMWEEDPIAIMAKDVLFHRTLRNEIQTLMLGHWDVKVVHEQLKLNHPKHMVPEMEVLEAFIYYFWDFSGMSAEDIFNFLKMSDDRAGTLAPAADGDLALAYARLGFRQHVEALDFHNDLIALASYQVNLARRAGADMNGSRLAGIAALGRVAQESLAMREEMQAEGTGKSIVDQVREFRLKKKKRSQPILSIDDLVQEEEVDLEQYDNVKRLPRPEGS